MRFWGTTVAVVGLVSLTALGASLAVVERTTSPTPATVPTTTTPGKTTPSTTTTSSTTTQTIVPVATCRLTDLDGVVVKETSAAGTQYVQVALHDYRGTSCTLKGTPSVTLLGAAGTPLATHEGTYLPTAFDGQADVDRLVLLNSSTTGGITGRASGWASFTFAYNGPGPLDEPTTACPTTSAIAVGLPSASGTVVVRAALRVFGPESATSVVCGSISVGSLYAGLGPQT